MKTNKYLVIQTNEDGRPCAWGLSIHKHIAEAEATRQWVNHHCYPGERRGKRGVHVLPVDSERVEDRFMKVQS